MQDPVYVVSLIDVVLNSYHEDPFCKVVSGHQANGPTYMDDYPLGTYILSPVYVSNSSIGR